MVNSTSCLLGSDIGTSSVKTKIYDLEGKTLGSARKGYTLSYPKPNWIELHADIIWKTVCETTKQAIKSAKIGLKDIEGISISSMTPSCLPIDKRGNPLRPAILWCDTRATSECRWVEENIGSERVQQICGNTISPYFGGFKWLWFKNNEPNLFDKTWKIIQCNSYVMYKLTGEVATDFSQAGLCVPAFEINKKDWSYDLCDIMKIDMDKLSNTYSSSNIIGEVTNQSADVIGLKKGTSVVAGGGDYTCSALGCGVFREGEACQMLGTAANLMVPVEGGSFDPRLINSVNINGNYISFGNVFAGGVIRWFRDLIKGFQKSTRIDLQFLDNNAEKIPLGSSGLILLPQFIGGIAPEWSLYTKGVIFGISPSHSTFHIYRAILEGVAYAFFYIFEIAQEIGTEIRSVITANGGAKSKLWRQIFADVMNLKIYYYKSGGDATLGDAILAGKGVGSLSSFNIIKEWLKDVEETQPNLKSHSKYLKYYTIYRDIYDHLKKDFVNLYHIREL